MTPLPYVLTLLAAHFAGDWWCQPREMAEEKSVYFNVLVNHLAIVAAWLAVGLSFAKFFGALPIEPWIQAPLIVKLLLNIVAHGIIDWNIWASYKKNKFPDFKYWKDKGFYDNIAIDQILHLSILMILFL